MLNKEEIFAAGYKFFIASSTANSAIPLTKATAKDFLVITKGRPVCTVAAKA